MVDKGEVEFIYPPDGNLKKRVFSGDETAPAIDPMLIQSAERIVEEMANRFSDCLAASLSEMKGVFGGTSDGSGTQSWDRIRDLAQELRSIAGTYGYPLVTEICGSLVVYLQGVSSIDERASLIIEKHLHALGVVHRDDIKGDGGDTGHALVTALGELAERSKPN